jgi:hypothetical protein
MGCHAHLSDSILLLVTSSRAGGNNYPKIIHCDRSVDNVRFWEQNDV